MKVYKFLGTLLCAGVVAASLSSAPAFADPGDKEGIVWAQSGGHTIIESLVPGETYSDVIKLWNDSDKPAISKFKVKRYGVNENDQYGYVSDDDPRATIADWLTYPEGDEYYLEPDEKIEVPYLIKVPKTGVINGAQSAAIVISSKDYDAEVETHEGVNVETEYAHIVYANIDNGEPLIEGVEIVDWGTPSIVLDNQAGIVATTTIKGTGNAFVPVKYKLEIYDTMKNDALAHESERTQYVLPDSQTLLTQRWQGTPALGLFRVHQTISYLGEVHNFEKTVLIVPLWLIILVIIFLVLAVVLIIRQSRKRKKDSK